MVDSVYLSADSNPSVTSVFSLVLLVFLVFHCPLSVHAFTYNTLVLVDSFCLLFYHYLFFSCPHPPPCPLDRLIPKWEAAWNGCVPGFLHSGCTWIYEREGSPLGQSISQRVKTPTSPHLAMVTFEFCGRLSFFIGSGLLCSSTPFLLFDTLLHSLLSTRPMLAFERR
jgi:hypothetical protein